MLSFLCVCGVLATTAIAQEAPVRSVRISFLPPPLEGTISLGVYDTSGKLVRVLHREAELAEFEVGADALHTKWDGRNDAGEALPAGKYSARGFAVGDLHVDDPQTPADATMPPRTNVSVKLVANPLAAGKRQVVEITAGYDEDGTFLQTADGLPLFTVDETPGVFRAWLTQRADKSLDLFQDDGDSVGLFHVTGAEQMMAFDAGEFELK
jgi:hypothetical protein